MWRRAGGAGLLLALVPALLVLGATPAGAAPALQLSPAAGAAGDTVTVTGTGFPAGEVEIRWGGTSGDLLTTATGPDFSVTATVPDVAPNSYAVIALVRDGGSVSSSNASFQVTPGAAPTATGSAPSRGGGIDGGLPDTTSGVDSVPPPVGTVPATTPATTATTAPAVTAPVTAAAPAAPTEAPATTTVPGPSAVPVSTLVRPPVEQPVAGDERVAGAAQPTSTSQSSGVVDSPALLVAGLGMVLAGTAVLVARSKRAPRGQYS